MKKRIVLCPVDYSLSMEPAIHLAADLAQAHESKVVLLHVVDPNENAISTVESQNNQFQERMRDQFLVQHDVEFEHVTRHGNPADTIIKFANQHPADFIVMGTHGRTGLARVVVGSVAQKVMARAKCPVVTVKLPSLPKGKLLRQSVRH